MLLMWCRLCRYRQTKIIQISVSLFPYHFKNVLQLMKQQLTILQPQPHKVKLKIGINGINVNKNKSPIPVECNIYLLLFRGLLRSYKHIILFIKHDYILNSKRPIGVTIPKSPNSTRDGHKSYRPASDPLSLSVPIAAARTTTIRRVSPESRRPPSTPW